MAASTAAFLEPLFLFFGLLAEDDDSDDDN